MFLEFLSHLLALDVGWVIQLIFSNLLWLFAFAAMVFIFLEGKKFLLGFFALVFSVWLWVDFQVISGWVWLVGTFLILHYVGKLAVITFGEADPKLKSRLIVLNEIQGIGTMAVFNLLIIGGLR